MDADDAREALWVLDMCRQFHCLPSALLAESAELIRALTIEGRVRDGQ